MNILTDNEQLLADVQRVSALQPKERLADPWARAILRQPGARRFLSKQHLLPTTTLQVAYVAMVTGCVLNTDATIGASSPVTSQKAEKIRAAARKLDDEVSNVSAVNPVVAEPAFRAGLDRLRTFYPPQNVPVRTRKGNPERRQFIWAVAKAFYRHFRDFHIQAITEIVALLWPATDERNVRHELTDERKAEIAEAAKIEIRATGNAVLEATAFLNRAQRKAPASEGIPVSSLSDSQRVRDTLAALKGLEDKELAASLVQGLQAILADFSFEFVDS